MTTMNATKNEASLNNAIFLINSLGGEPLPVGADRNTLRVILENQSATDIPNWMLDVVAKSTPDLRVA